MSASVEQSWLGLCLSQQKRAVQPLSLAFPNICTDHSSKQLRDLRHGYEHAPARSGERQEIVGAVKAGCGFVLRIDDEGIGRDLRPQRTAECIEQEQFAE